MPGRRLVLASASPRRRDLLDQLGVSYTVNPAHIDEAPAQGESPADYVRRMAREKARAVAAASLSDDRAVLAADTIVVLGDMILGKPRDRADALGMLATLSGRTHSVMTAVHLSSVAGENGSLVETGVEFVTLSREMCEAYLQTEEAWDKAGAYAIQGLGGAFVRAIHGSYSNVVGLPLAETWQLLREGGIATALEASPT
jgi:septum formation protein